MQVNESCVDFFFY